MPDAKGNVKGIALGGKASESWERIFGKPTTVDPDVPKGQPWIVPVEYISEAEARRRMGLPG